MINIFFHAKDIDSYTLSHDWYISKYINGFEYFR